MVCELIIQYHPSAHTPCAYYIYIYINTHTHIKSHYTFMHMNVRMYGVFALQWIACIVNSMQGARELLGCCYMVTRTLSGWVSGLN